MARFLVGIFSRRVSQVLAALARRRRLLCATAGFGLWSSVKSLPQVQAYSLYPVKNPTTSTNWFQVGTNLINDTGSGMLSAATSPDGRIGVALTIIGSPNSAAVVGSSLTGFGAAMTGVQAIDFDRNGNLVQGTLNTIPVNQLTSPVGSLVDIAVSSLGDVGAVDANFKYYQIQPIDGWLGIP